MTIRKMTAKQAFLFLSKEFEKAPKNYPDQWGYEEPCWSFTTKRMFQKDEHIYEREGICSGIDMLNYRKKISDVVARKMRTIMKKTFKKESVGVGFFWDTHQYDSDPTRAAACFYLASKCR